MAAKLLLLKDVEALGRSGEVVSVKPGFARNFLIPFGFALVATKQTLRQQDLLKRKREEQAVVDRKDSEALADRLKEVVLTALVKVDHEGRMYGSVDLHKIAQLLEEQAQITLEKKALQLKHSIKTTGQHVIAVKLKEGVSASFSLQILPEEGISVAQQSTTVAK